jgi:hypothetical protein
LLETDYSTAVANAEYIKQLMVDPATASAMARAGVTLNDTPEQINAKLAQDAYNQENISKANEMSADGYTTMTKEQAALKPPSEVVTITDAKGNQTYYWKKPEASQQIIGSAESGYTLVSYDNQGNIISQKQVTSGTSGTTTTGFKSSKVESDIRSDYVELLGDNTDPTYEDRSKIYNTLRTLYGSGEVTDDALRNLLGLETAQAEAVNEAIYRNLFGLDETEPVPTGALGGASFTQG